MFHLQQLHSYSTIEFVSLHIGLLIFGSTALRPFYTVCVCVCLLTLTSYWVPKSSFYWQNGFMFAKEGHFYGPCNFKGLFEGYGKNWVSIFYICESPHNDRNVRMSTEPAPSLTNPRYCDCIICSSNTFWFCCTNLSELLTVFCERNRGSPNYCDSLGRVVRG